MYFSGNEFRHPPLPFLLGSALASLVSLTREAVRAGGLILHLVLMFQVRSMLMRLTSCRTSSLMGFWLVATLPVTAGWFRMDFPEPLVSVMLLLTLGVIMQTGLSRVRDAAWLGLVVGLGSLTKLSYCVFILAPGLAYLAMFVRDRIMLRNSLVVAAVWGAVGGWWYLLSAETIWHNLQMSTHRQLDLSHRFSAYFGEAPEWPFVLLLALAGIPLAYRGFPAQRRGILLLAITLGCGVFGMLFIFDPQERYMVPLHAIAMVLLCAGGAAILRRAGARVHGLTVLLVILCLVGVSTVANTGPPTSRPVELYSPRGLMAVEQHDLTGLRRAHDWIRDRTPFYVLVALDGQANGWLSDQHLAVLREGDHPPALMVEDLLRGPRISGALYAIEARFVSGGPGKPSKDRALLENKLPGWFLDQERTQLATFSDDAGIEYRIYLIKEPNWGDLPGRRAGTP